MTTGTVKWFNSRKGYGFIQPENGGKDVFVHITKLEEKGLRKLYEGQRVSYEIYDDRGRTACRRHRNIVIVGKSRFQKAVLCRATFFISV